MVQSLDVVMFCVFLQHFLKSINAQTEELASSEDVCDSVPLESYNVGFRIGSIFIILGTSAIGTYTPILLYRISPYKRGGVRDWLLTVGKFFGTGVILATAFVHMLPEAMENFSSPCLTKGWLSYSAFAGVFCMIASFSLQLLEIASVAHVNKLRNSKKERGDIEQRQVEPIQIETHTVVGQPTMMKTENETRDSGLVDVCHHEYPTVGDHGHVHTAFLDSNDAYKHIRTYILELGIVLHSIIIGITLATTDNDEFMTLLIALVFHQGMALGTRLNEIKYKRWYKPALMGLVYIIMTPIGIAIGIGIRSNFNANSYSSILSSAILDSLSAGILLYNAYVSLMSMEMSHNTTFHNASTTRKVYSFIAMYLGAGLMSLIGTWA